MDHMPINHHPREQVEGRLSWGPEDPDSSQALGTSQGTSYTSEITDLPLKPGKLTVAFHI